MMALHFKHEVLDCEYVNEQEFSGVLRQVLRKVSLYARAHAYECANIVISSYPKLSKRLISQESPCCSQRETQTSKMRHIDTIFCLQ